MPVRAAHPTGMQCSFASRARSYRSSVLVSDLSFIGINRKVSLKVVLLPLAFIGGSFGWILRYGSYLSLRGLLRLAVFYAS
ncbi:MAG: hypothetical protein U1C96_10440 [Gallionella sp.]|nr:MULTISPECIES: hypothetical protein [unclassified Pseudomonas]MDZ4202547.1 hypothetical protein [Gallionella sp.]